jgi:uncharacterized membrane protein YesL
MIFGGQDFNDMGGTVTGKVDNGKGVGRVWGMIMDNTARFFLSNLICVVALLPLTAGILAALALRSPLLLMVAGVIGGAIEGPFYACMIDGILAALRGFPGNWWRRYRMVLKRDWKSDLAPGIVMGVFMAVVVDLLVIMNYGETPELGLFFTILCAAILLVLFTYLWPQRVLLDLKLPEIIKNSILMILMHPLVTLGALAIQLAYWGLMLILIPYSSLFLIVLGFWFPALLSTTAIYGRLNEDLKIEERFGIVPPEEPEEDEEDED